MHFIFDVDGTLTPSKSRIDRKFGAWFHKFCETNKVYLITGGGRSDTLKQVGEPIYHQCVRVYQCSGNDVWVGDRNIRSNNIEITDEMHQFFSLMMVSSKFEERTGNHLDQRPGLFNFSILGRNATPEQRVRYVEYDLETSERHEIARLFNEEFNRKGYEANVAGETGLDITRMGNGKEQIIQDFTPKDELTFFGDMTEPGGNDHLLAQIVHRAYQVNGWNDTWEILKAL